MSGAVGLEFAAEAAAGRAFDLELATVTDAGNELMGYRLYTPGCGRASRLYLSREDALDAWINRCIEWDN